MLFIRTISVVAALAFATLSSAAPVDGAGLVARGEVSARDVAELDFSVKRDPATINEVVENGLNNIEKLISNIR